MSLKKAHSVADMNEFTYNDITNSVIEQDEWSASIMWNEDDLSVIVNTSEVESQCIHEVQSDKSKLERLIKKSTDEQIKQVNQKHVWHKHIFNY